MSIVDKYIPFLYGDLGVLGIAPIPLEQLPVPSNIILTYLP